MSDPTPESRLKRIAEITTLSENLVKSTFSDTRLAGVELRWLLEDRTRLEADNARLLSALTQARELCGMAAEKLSRFATNMDPNLTKHICAFCHSWVWDDDEEHRKEIDHTPDCLVTKLRASADDAEGKDNG